MKNLSILLFISSGFLFSCGSDNVDLAIDNPGKNPIIVTIDTLEVEVPGREVAWVEMGKGEHKVKVNDSVFTYNFTEQAYFLNPTMTSYLKSEAFYGDALQEQTYVKSLPVKKINYLGMEIEGNYDVVDQLLVPVSWEYGPREALPEMVQLDEDEPYEAFVKLSDPLEILEKIQSSYESDGAATSADSASTVTQ